MYTTLGRTRAATVAKASLNDCSCATAALLAAGSVAATLCAVVSVGTRDKSTATVAPRASRSLRVRSMLEPPDMRSDCGGGVSWCRPTWRGPRLTSVLHRERGAVPRGRRAIAPARKDFRNGIADARIRARRIHRAIIRSGPPSRLNTHGDSHVDPNSPHLYVLARPGAGPARRPRGVCSWQWRQGHGQSGRRTGRADDDRVQE